MIEYDDADYDIHDLKVKHPRLEITGEDPSGNRITITALRLKSDALDYTAQMKVLKHEPMRTNLLAARKRVRILIDAEFEEVDGILYQMHVEPKETP